jgi:hypothetical protein
MTPSPSSSSPVPARRPALSLEEAAAKAQALLSQALAEPMLLSRTLVECALHELRRALEESSAREEEGRVMDGVGSEVGAGVAMVEWVEVAA